MDKDVMNRFQTCWKGYLGAPDTVKWMDNIKEVNPDANDMVSVRIDTALASLKVVRTFSKMADPEVITGMSGTPESLAHYNYHAEQLQGGLEATLSTYICEMMLQNRFKSSKVIRLMTAQYLEAPYQKVMSKERAVLMLSNAVANHLLGKEKHLYDFFAACRAIQDNFEACKIFDWLAGAADPDKYDWTPEGQARQKKEYEERMAAMSGGGLGRMLFQAIGGEELKARIEEMRGQALEDIAAGSDDKTPPTLLH